MSGLTIQESFFGAALQGGRHVTVYLLNGIKVSGVLETAEQAHLVFKHSITAAFICHDRQCISCSPNQTPNQNEEIEPKRVSGL
jgi:sRNA-binding regulator protein Hfq